MNSSSSGKRLESFLSGKGFYIVLFLCAAVIGASAWMMAAGNATMGEDAIQTNADGESRRVETVIIPARPDRSVEEPILEAEAPQISDEELSPVGAPSEEPVVAAEAPAPVYAWPVSGEIERAHSGDTLVYDATMRDWRVHEGVDILADPGTPVQAACAGTVESVRADDLLGTVVVINHGNGSRSIYANLQEEPPVEIGQWVEAGQIVGAVGHSAIGEVNQSSHLHFSVEMNGRAVDPSELIPG